MDRSVAAKDLYVNKTTLRCLCCHKTIVGSKSRGNLDRHWGGTIKEHRDNAKSARGAERRGTIVAQMAAAAAAQNPQAAVEAAAREDGIRNKRANLRAALALHGSVYCPRTNVHRFFEGTMFEAATLLKSTTGSALGGVVGTMIDRGKAMLERKQAEKLKDQFVAVLTDEASSHLGSIGRVFGITVMHASGSMLVDAVANLDQVGIGDDGPPPAAAAAPAGGVDDDLNAEEKGIAEAIRELPGNAPQYMRAAIAVRRRLLALRINLKTQLTAIVGDNHPFNPALAKALGVPFLRCLPHCLALTFNAVTSPFKQFVAGTLGMSALLKAGGGKHRREAFAAAGLNVAKFYCLATRWNQLYDAAMYMFSDVGGRCVFDIVRELLESHPALPSRARPSRRRRRRRPRSRQARPAPTSTTTWSCTWASPRCLSRACSST
jgi:hypothetical protein